LLKLGRRTNIRLQDVCLGAGISATGSLVAVAADLEVNGGYG